MVGTLPIKLKVQHHRNCNKAAQYVARKKIIQKNKILEEAVRWCRTNNKRGWSAIKSGFFPGIKCYRRINKRLDGHIVTGEEKQYCSLLTAAEEEDLVRHLRNRNRCFQGMSKKEVTELIIKILQVREASGKKFKYRKTIPLSRAAKRVLLKKTVSQSFWNRFMMKHKKLIALKRQGSVNIRRAVNCTRSMAVEHLDNLAAKLISAGIFTNAKKEGPGQWSGNIDTTRIFNHDETPQMMNYGVDGTASGRVIAGVGTSETCQKICKENRETTTVHPIVSCSGEKAMCQVIFARKGITSDMTSKTINNLVISTTKSGVQDQHSLKFFYKNFDKYLTTNKIKKPVVILSDGHSSRFVADTFHFLRNNDIRLFVSPPDTTSVTQLLDQVNKALHESYKNKKKNFIQ